MHYLRFAIAVWMLMVASAALAEDTLRVGMAEIDITPPEGYPMAGYYHQRLATGQRDPLKARAIVFRQQNGSAAVVVADLTAIARDLYLQVRQRVAQRTGILPEHVVLSATHSHTAPDYSGELYQKLAELTPAGQAPAYVEVLIESIAEAVVQADAAAQPVRISTGRGQQQPQISFNRRFVMKDGSVRTWQRNDNPDVVRAAGPIDPELGLVVFESLEPPRKLGLLSNFALHLDTVGGLQWSADYPYYVEQALREQWGSEAISIFTAGTCGDINHNDPDRRDRNSTEVIGKALAASISAALPSLVPLDSPRLQIRSTNVSLPLQDVTVEQLERAEQLLPAARAGERIEFFDLVAAYKSLIIEQLRRHPPRVTTAEHISWGATHSWRGVGDTLPVEVTAIALGDELAMVFLPGEVFVELGLAIKRGSPYRTTLVIELSNCIETAYIPTRAAYAGGGYEVVNTTLQPGGGEMLVEASLKLLREIASTR